MTTERDCRRSHHPPCRNSYTPRPSHRVAWHFSSARDLQGAPLVLETRRLPCESRSLLLPSLPSSLPPRLQRRLPTPSIRRIARRPSASSIWGCPRFAVNSES